MQLFVPLHQTDVVAIEQPVDLLPGQRHHRILRSRPAEFLLRQAFVIQHEAVVFPEQQLDLVAESSDIVHTDCQL